MGKRLDSPEFLVCRPVTRSMGRVREKPVSVKVDKSQAAFPQAEFLRDEPYRRWIASLPCCICGRPDVQCAHVRYGLAGGMALKPSDDRTVPLCLSHHVEQGPDEKGFWAFYGIDPILLSSWLRTSYLKDRNDTEYAIYIIRQCQPKEGV